VKGTQQPVPTFQHSSTWPGSLVCPFTAVVPLVTLPGQVSQKVVVGLLFLFGKVPLLKVLRTLNCS
jgi:hypothetical protein